MIRNILPVLSVCIGASISWQKLGISLFRGWIPLFLSSWEESCLTHSNPGAHGPQSELQSGVELGPHSSPSCRGCGDRIGCRQIAMSLRGWIPFDGGWFLTHSNPGSQGSQLNLHVWLEIWSHSSPFRLGLGLTGGSSVGLTGGGGGPEDRIESKSGCIHRMSRDNITLQFRHFQLIEITCNVKSISACFPGKSFPIFSFAYHQICASRGFINIAYGPFVFVFSFTISIPIARNVAGACAS